jgi:hypothetical protein
MRIFQPIISGSLIQSGSAVISGSLNVLSGITGSVFGTASVAVTASYIPTLKSLSGSAASFAGNPYSASITFLNSYTNNYGVSVIGEDSRAWSISGKSSTGFTIDSNSSVGLTGAVYWIATPFNS